MSRIAYTPPVLVEPTPRKQMTPARKREAFETYGKVCQECGASLTTKAEIDHRMTLWMGGPDDLANLRPLCIPCHKVKTAADAGQRAKTKAQAKLRLDVPVEPSARPLQSRGFDKCLSKRFDGSVVSRQSRKDPT